MRNSVPDSVPAPGIAPGAIHERKLSAALRAQAGGVGPGSPLELGSPLQPACVVSPSRGPAHAKPRPSAWTVLGMAVLLGAMAGGLAGVISIW